MKAILLFAALAAGLFASVGHISAIRGDALIFRNAAAIRAQKGASIEESDRIKTAANALVRINFVDNTRLSLGKNSELEVKKYLINGRNSRVHLAANKGSYELISGKISQLARDNFRFQAHTATVGIRGTKFLGELGGAGGKIACTQGAIDLKVGGHSQRLNAGQQAEYTLDEIMNLGKFSAGDFSITEQLGVDFQAPKSASDFVSNKKRAMKPVKGQLDLSKVRDEDDELDEIMGGGF